MKNDEDQETIDRIKARLNELQETFARGLDDAIELHADMRARIQLIAADQQRSTDILKGMRNEL